MKLLLDENLSRRVAALLDASFPGTTHVVLVGLERADDAFADPAVGLVELIP